MPKPVDRWRGPFARASLTALALLMLTHPSPTRAAEVQGLSTLEQRGRQIYEKGTSSSGEPLFGRLGRRGVRLPASAIPCASCHGADGRGRPEGGVAPSNITWSNLTKAYGQRHEDRRSHPPYDVQSLQTAVREGRDPAGNPLDFAMPRYDLPAGDAAALAAYIQRLERILPTGVTDEEITVAMIYPDAPHLADVRNSIRATLAAYFDTVNAQSGIYRRRLRLVGPSDAPQAFVAIGDADALGALPVPEHAPPTIVPMTFSGESVARPDRPAYFLLPPVADQMLAIVQRALTAPAPAGRSDPARTVVLFDDDDSMATIRATVERHLVAKGGRARVVTVPRGSDWRRPLASLRGERVDRVVLAGGTDLVLRFAEASVAEQWRPDAYVLGVLVGPELFETLKRLEHTMFVAYPNLPGAASEEGLAEFRAVLNRAGVPVTHPAAQSSAMAAAKLLVEALRRAGRTVTPETFIASLHSIIEFPTGLMPLLSFGPNRRIGVQGIYLLAFDPRSRSFGTAPEWIDLPTQSGL